MKLDRSWSTAQR